MKQLTMGALVLSLTGGLTLPAGAQQQTGEAVRLSLDAALERTLSESEEVRLARTRLDAADARADAAWSAALPQINTQLAYTKALRSVFSDAGGGVAIPDSLRFDPDPTAPIEQRVAYLEDRTPTAAVAALGGLFNDLPFGNENTWVAGLSVSQPVFAGGRIQSQIEAARHAEDAARYGYEDAAADVVLQVRRAYYDAALAGATQEIVEASVELAREHLSDVRLRESAGRASELEVLRAEVELENLVPQSVQAGNARELALLNLKRLVNLPADAELELTTELVAADAPGGLAVGPLPPLERVADEIAGRASLRAARSQVAIAEEQVDIARSAYLPSVSLNANLTRQAFPTGDFGIPGGGDWRDDWSVGFAVSWPLFQGLRRSAQLDEAEAQREQAELQFAQLRESVALEYEQALGEMERSRALIAAAERTVEQAERVYALTELRFEEGLATQLEVADARLALQQARLNRVQAQHDALVALARAERALGVAVEMPGR